MDSKVLAVNYQSLQVLNQSGLTVIGQLDTLKLDETAYYLRDLY
ncbi:MAG TPA: hypothetical protein PLF13_00320 [candidate division Zixibacteria bacterium]|nr:hypothetical protein [candidate division Zixibacteria bacterium]